MTKNNESNFNLRVIEVKSSVDVTNIIDDFELKESQSASFAWMVIDGAKSGLLQMRKNPKNKVYSIKITDDKNNEIFRMMEVADDLVNGEPVFLKLQKNQKV